MTSLPRPRRSFSCAIVNFRTIAIYGDRYDVESFDPGYAGTYAVRLCKHGSDAVYDVHRSHDGLVVCDCPSYVVTHDGTVSMCKHGRALVQLGMIDPPFCPPAPFELGISEPAAAPVYALTAGPADPIRAQSLFDGPVPDPTDATDWDLDDRIGLGPDSDPEATDWDLDDRIGLGPDSDPDGDPAAGLPLADYVRGEAAWYRLQGGAAALLVAETLETLARGLDACTTPGKAITPDLYRDRIEVLNRDCS